MYNPVSNSQPMSLSRRKFLKASAMVGTAFLSDFPENGESAAQSEGTRAPSFAETSVLRIAYEDHGSKQGFPIVLLHGFPDDIHAWDGVTPALVKAGYRVLVPYLRGYGPTRFRDPAAPPWPSRRDRAGRDRFRRCAGPGEVRGGGV